MFKMREFDNIKFVELLNFIMEFEFVGVVCYIYYFLMVIGFNCILIV